MTSPTITRADVATVQNIVLHGLECIKSGGFVDWSPWQVLNKCASGEWHLLMIGEERFMIISLNINTFTDERFLCMEAVYCQGFNDIVTVLPEIDQLAREMGCAYIEMQSNRKGFERTGWTVHDISYRRRLS